MARIAIAIFSSAAILAAVAVQARAQSLALPNLDGEVNCGFWATKGEGAPLPGESWSEQGMRIMREGGWRATKYANDVGKCAKAEAAVKADLLAHWATYSDHDKANCLPLLRLTDFPLYEPLADCLKGSVTTGGTP